MKQNKNRSQSSITGENMMIETNSADVCLEDCSSELSININASCDIANKKSLQKGKNVNTSYSTYKITRSYMSFRQLIRLVVLSIGIIM